MRRTALVLSLLALSACARTPGDRNFTVFFNDFSNRIDPTAQQIVAAAAASARAHPSSPVKVTGYADRAGSTEADVRLSKGRSDAVTYLLERNGIPNTQIFQAAVGTPLNTQPGVERRRVDIFVDFP